MIAQSGGLSESIAVPSRVTGKPETIPGQKSLGEVEAPIGTSRRLRGLNIPRLKSLTAIGVMQHKFIGAVDWTSRKLQTS
jgi:hypothetical protein